MTVEISADDTADAAPDTQPADPIARVRASWCAFTAPLEGSIATLYCDVRGLPTVADGCLVPSVAAAQGMPWLRADGSPASPAEVAAEWHRVKGLGAGHVWSYYARATKSPLHLSPEAIDALTLARFDADVAILSRELPGLPSWPWQAVAATLSMAWAMGAGFPASWPRWAAAARASNWIAAAADCEIRWRDNPGVRPRNFAQQALFRLAGAATEDAARAGWPTGPSADVAARALAAFG